MVGGSSLCASERLLSRYDVRQLLSCGQWLLSSCAGDWGTFQVMGMPPLSLGCGWLCEGGLSTFGARGSSLIMGLLLSGFFSMRFI